MTERSFIQRGHRLIRRYLLTLLASIALLLPTPTFAQSGDASWLNSIEGLDLAIGRSWMAPVVFETESITTDYNEQGTPVSVVTTWSTPESTPIVTAQMQTIMLSTLIYQFDSAANAANGMELLHAEQMEQLGRDPRSPATNEFDPGDLGDATYAYEGLYTPEDLPEGWSEFALVILWVQDGDTVYQLFGQFVPGDHTEIATGVVSDMLAADIGTDAPVYDINGLSQGGLWEKLNGIDLAMPEGSTVFDLEIYPPGDDAVMGDSVVVPVIDLNNLGNVPGSTDSWHIAYGEDHAGTPTATPLAATTDAFSIELWVMEFEDPTHASAAAYAFNDTLIEPLGIIYTEGLGTSDEDGEGLTMVSAGFVRDNALPEGEAAVAVSVTGSTVYAARVYSRETAPTPIARDLVSALQATPPGDDNEHIDGLVATGGGWDRFPQAGDPLLHELVPIDIRHDPPITAPATPMG